jgi:hypothetical protein
MLRSSVESCRYRLSTNRSETNRHSSDGGQLLIEKNNERTQIDTNTTHQQTTTNKQSNKQTNNNNNNKQQQVHDCFSANELLTYEALGLCATGDAGRLIERGDVTYGGRWVVNPSGGLISKGLLCVSMNRTLSASE